VTFCEQCGSSSRDHDGFCGGCGAPWPVAASASHVETAGALKSPAQSAPHHTESALAAVYADDPLDDQDIWVYLGRIGLRGWRAMNFGDFIRALIVMAIGIVMYIYAGGWVAYLMLPAWVIWVVWAARN